MSEIPDQYISLAKELAEIAQRHGLRDFRGTITPTWNEDWTAPINFAWVRGRHGDSTHQIKLTSSVEVTAEIQWSSAQPQPAEPK